MPQADRQLAMFGLARMAFRALRRVAYQRLSGRWHWLYDLLFEDLRIKLILWTRPRRLEAAAALVAATGILDCAYSNVLHRRIATPLDSARFYLASWSRGIDPRKPFPGFHPGVYAEARGLNARTEPLLDFLATGCRAGPWCADLIVSENGAAVQPAVAEVRSALHVHCYYPELLPRIMQGLLLNQARPDLLISVARDDAQKEVREMLESYPANVLVRKMANRGRDLGPLFTGFRADILGRYDIIGHFHTKKSPYHEAFGERWMEFLREHLLGGRARMVDTIFARMHQDRSIGMVFPDDPRAEGWRANRDLALALAPRMGLDALPANFWFPLGSMFWARVDALAPVWRLGLSWDDYPPEPVPVDGSMLHALERLLGLGAPGVGLCNALTHVPGVSL